jgi:hypothetical protein
MKKSIFYNLNSKFTRNKLSLRREIIVLLQTVQLSDVAGGDFTGPVCETMISRTGACGTTH